jgi:predicted RNA binding protein YcfA (HicA-like mRNA interferase family)
MTKIEKLIKKIENNPKDVKYSDLKKYLEYYGYKLDRQESSHHAFRNEHGDSYTIPAHKQGAVVRECYVDDVIEMVKGGKK